MPEISLISKRNLEKETIAKKRDYYAVIHNSLLRYNRYTGKAKGNLLSRQELKVFLYALCSIRPSDTGLKPITMNIKEFGRVCGINASNGNYYSQVKDSVAQLASRVMWIKNPDGSEELIHLLKDAIIPATGGKITLYLDPKLGRYILDVTSDYSKFPYHDVCCMKSQYGIWLWMILSCYTFGHSQDITFDIDELKEYMDCTDYTKISNFKNKVIDVAVRDINTYTAMKITGVSYERSGRSIKYVTFHIQNLLKLDPKEYSERFHRVERELAEGLNK